MQIRVAVADPESAEALFLNAIQEALHKKAAVDSASAEDLVVAWNSPKVRTGFAESYIEYLGQIGLVAAPVSVLSGLVTNYLWELISKLRQARSKIESQQGGSTVEITITNGSKSAKFDENAELGSIVILVGSVFDQQGPE